MISRGSIMEEYLLKIQPFDLDNIPSTELRQRWLEYKKQFTYISSAMSKKKRKKLKNIFLVVAGRQLQRVYENLPPRDNVENDEETDEFKILIDQLDGYFAPKQHDMLERYTFGSLVPDAGETLDKFLLRAQAEANKCQFGSTTAESREIAVIDKLFKINSVDESNVVAHQVPEVMAGSGSVGGEGAPFICAIGENHDELIWCRIGGITVEMMIDSGSKYNIIDEFTWKFLRNRNAEICALEPSSKCLTAYAQTVCLNVVGSFEANISVVSDKKKACLRTAFYVIKDGKQNLLGRDSAKQLGVLRIGLPNTWESNSINNIPEDVQHFPVIKGVKLRIEIDISVTPVAQHVRRVPIALRQKVEDQIQKLLHSGIIERVEEHSPWVSPMVVVMKDNGEVRLCIDMRRANTAIKREYHMIPTLDDLLSRLNGCCWFSRLDVKDAYHQVELDESCRYITTFITHLGMFRYTRLMFGICSASEHFQKIIEQILASCQNSFNYQDDIFVYAKSLAEHDAALDSVLKALEERRVVLNIKKCKFRVNETVFLGHHISGQGIRPSSEKVVAVENFRAPRTAEEVRSFLGLVGYVGRFIPDLATRTFDLRQLLVMGQKFEWLEKHDTAFRNLKNAVCRAPILGYFDNVRRTRIVTDASPVGLGAVLLQFEGQSDTVPIVISYASKSLSQTERRYCQTEKEALAIVWGIEKFQLFLHGREFELETDHRPLTAIFKPTSRPPGRIERWVLRLQSFRFRVLYKPGKQNIADALSRLSVSADSADVDDSDEVTYVNSLIESVAVDIAEIRAAILCDEQSVYLKEAIESDNWSDDSVSSRIKEFVPFKGEIYVVEGVIVRGSRLVIPKSLQPRILQLAHEGHPGETAMILRLRERVWWPGIDKDARAFVKSCEGCRLVGRPSAPEPMRRRIMPVEPWIDIAIDFLGPLPTGEYLLVAVDYYSRYKEVCVMRRITSEETIKESVHYKIPSLRDIETTPPIDPEACDRDLVNKYHGKEREDNRRHAKPCGIVEGDRVIVQNLISGNKLQPTFAPTRYEVIRRKGNQVEIKDQNGNTFVRNTAHLKKVSAGDDGSGIQVEPVVSQGGGSSIQVEPVVLQDQQMPSDQQRPSRSANPPYWHQDFVFD
ncbi:uncharacterized protein K02A2.6-like [Uranotaenia lowii]|uniref:uncharacterized protein K02A2.6-like n=1 Tax=Uranotaenia lowii TaxID=190385 RepID=UPI0024798BFE|nr:uncharacterized protein K02A2.6-like [Uranotaenia lowii]